jgi:hypothetical protein
LRTVSFVIFPISLIVLLSSGCEKSNGPLALNPDLPSGISGIRSLRYEYVATSPAHSQTSMLALYNNKLYRIGSKWPINVFDLTAASWTQVPLPDSTYWRWDGAALTIGDTIYIAAVNFGFSVDILAFHAPTTMFRHTGANLPNAFMYPAICEYQNNLIVFSMVDDSVLSYSVATGTLRKIAPNPFFDATALDMPLFSGKYGNSLFVFGQNPSRTTTKFARLDLSSKQWEDIVIPPVLANKQVTGSVFGGIFVFLCDTTMTFQYSIPESMWFIDTSRVAVFPRTLNGDFFIGEWSYCSSDSCLYGTEVVSDMVWRISR